MKNTNNHVKTPRLILYGFLINYLFTAIYQPFFSPLTSSSISSISDISNLGVFLLCIPLAWFFYTFFIFAVFPSYSLWAINRFEIVGGLGKLLPIFVSVLLLIDLIVIVYLLLSGNWKTLTQKTKFFLILFATLCFNLICFDCCAFSLRA